MQQMNAAASAGGGVVQLEAGDYVLNSPINWPASNIILRGAGQNLTRLVWQGWLAPREVKVWYD